MNFKEAYYYLYYKLFKLWGKIENPFLSTSFRAMVSIGIIEICAVVTLFTYYDVLTGNMEHVDIFSFKLLVPFILASVSVSYSFIYSNDWKKYFEKFDRWPKRKNNIGGMIVWSFIVFVLINVFVSVELLHYKMSK